MAQIRAATDRPFSVNLLMAPKVAPDSATVDAALERLRPWYAILGEEPPAAPNQFAPDFEGQLAALIAAAPPVASFAFDVLKRVNPSYGLRMLGFAVATAGLVPIWAAVAASLLAQDRLPLSRLLREADHMRRQRILTDLIFGRALREYVARDFHPLDRDNYPMVQAFLADFEATMARGGAA